MRDPLEQAREAAADARISHPGEPDWRRVRWAMERYLEASRQHVENLQEFERGEIGSVELEARAEELAGSLIRARDHIWLFTSETQVDNAPPECLGSFFKGVEYLNKLCIFGDNWYIERALRCFRTAEESLSRLVRELSEIDTGDGPGGSDDGGAGRPSPLSPRPNLWAGDAKSYPPDGE